MSTALPPRPRELGPRSDIAIVVSKYNEKYTDAMVENTSAELQEILPGSTINLYRVPGAFEIPIAVEHVLRTDKPEIVIALGLIIRGGTQHGDLVAQSVTTNLQEIAVRHCKPVVNEVLLVDDEKQAYARCIGSELNRGREAARVACDMASFMKHSSDTVNNQQSAKSTKSPFRSNRKPE